ncbi:hypothetical protein AK830_g933 [Neonectria ditissima]|uniref:Beta-lactamase-related domain-containing protein n=1 Tax=Neonectria ditissima TaxID=78410 RepID=A0A0N8H8V7_9HYPO|nr:hypothetical protein AK830_g933 [Neonectria ditissima]
MFPSVASLLACCLSLCSVAQATAIEHRAASTSARDIQTYYNVEGSRHAEKAKALTADGYQIISLSTYGSPPDVKYAAIWSRRQGNPFEVIQGADKKTYDAWLEGWKTEGFVSTHVSATGPVDSAVFAGVVEKVNVTSWAQVCDLTNPWGYENATGGVSMTIKGFRMYGTPSDRRYCILGHENVNNDMSTIFYTTNYSIDYAEVYRSETQKRFWRPAHLFLSEDHVITPQFVDTDVGTWVAKEGLSADKLAKEIKAQKNNGLVPIDLQGGGNGKEARFSVIFAEQDVPSPRKWSVTGTTGGFKDNKGAQAAMDNVMKNWMKKNGVRQAQVAIASNGTVLTERSYTWAEGNRAVVKPDDIFLLASVSKMFVHAAIYNLIQAGHLNYSTPVYPLLGYNPEDDRANNITIQNLLEHTAGYDRSVSGDPGFMFQTIAFAQSNGTRPASLRDVIEYMVARPLDYAPGDGYAYSNYGSMLLSYVVTNVTSTPYLKFLQKNILKGLNVQLYQTSAKKHENDRIVQESKYTGYDPVHPKTYKLVPGPNGGDGAIKEESMGGFSLAASASSIASFIGHHSVYGTGDREWNGWRDGTTAGARTFAESRGDFDWAFNLNTREYLSEEEFDDLRYWKMPFLFEDFPLA